MLLGQKICEKPQIVGDYEAGRGIPNQQVLAKIERAIGMKLRGKDKGQALQPLGKK
jgi:putative transcription factor